MASITNLTDQYEHALHLWDELHLLNTWVNGSIDWKQHDKKQEAFAHYQAAVKEINSPEALFEIFKRICFGGNEGYQSIPELTISPQDMVLSDDAKLASDGAFLLSARQVPSRIMRGYNPILQVHFIALKGLSFYGKYRNEVVQIIAQQNTIEPCRGYWISNWSSQGCHCVRANLLYQFIGEGEEQKLLQGSSKDREEEWMLGLFTRDEHKRLMHLKIFIDAPKIMKIASEILSKEMLSHLSDLIVGYYSFEASTAIGN